MNRAQKGWITRYQNEKQILEDQMEEMREDLHKDFISFITKTSKYHRLTEQHVRMCNEIKKFHRKHNGGSSLEEKEKMRT